MVCSLIDHTVIHSIISCLYHVMYITCVIYCAACHTLYWNTFVRVKLVEGMCSVSHIILEYICYKCLAHSRSQHNSVGMCYTSFLYDIILVIYKLQWNNLCVHHLKYQYMKHWLTSLEQGNMRRILTW